jgi:sarcosine oxidase subunit beta
MTSDADVVIVGAGIMGLSLAWALVKRGRRVLCVERGRLAGEASAANAGTLAVQNKPLGSIPLTLESMRLWAALGEELGGTVEFEQRGGLRVAHTTEDLQKLTLSHAAQANAGAPVELLDRDEALARAPYLSPAISGASYCALDGMANPFLASRRLFTATRAAGVSFMFDCAVTDVHPQPDGTVRVVAGAGIIAAPVVVIASGAWIPVVAAHAGVPLPIETKVQQVLITDGGAAPLTHVITHVRGNLTLKQQRATGKVLVGGGWAGVSDGEREWRRLSRASIIGNARAALATVPGLASARWLRGWTGFEGRTPDKLPVIGPLPGIAGLHVLGCASGGFTLAPASAELLARRLCGEPETVASHPFSPARFVSPAVASTHDVH